MLFQSFDDAMAVKRCIKNENIGKNMNWLNANELSIILPREKSGKGQYSSMKGIQNAFRKAKQNKHTIVSLEDKPVKQVHLAVGQFNPDYLSEVAHKTQLDMFIVNDVKQSIHDDFVTALVSGYIINMDTFPITNFEYKILFQYLYDNNQLAPLLLNEELDIE